MTLVYISPAHALDQIIRPYQSVRSAGMGNVRLTTGIYDENFFGNPARVTANPRFKITVLDLAAEFNGSSVDTASDLMSDGDTLQKIGGTAGKNNHGRVQTSSLSVYVPPGDGKMAFAVGIISSAQFDVDLRQSYQVSPQGYLDVGPAVTIGRKFLEKDELSVGITTHMTYRVASSESYTMVDFLKGRSLSPTQSGGSGSHIDFDLGSTYELPFKLWDFDFTAGAAINNILGGRYSNLSFSPIETGVKPTQQPRTYGAGIAARRPDLGPFSRAVFAFEITDVGNNPNGGLFRTLHLGGEVRYGVLAPRLGLNQGYLTAGLGLDLRHFTLDLATYGEEMSLNSGGFEDRRFSLRFAFEI